MYQNKTYETRKYNSKPSQVINLFSCCAFAICCCCCCTLYVGKHKISNIVREDFDIYREFIFIPNHLQNKKKNIMERRIHKI